MKIRKKKQLEIILENIPKHPNPKVELEQYSTPSSIASDLIWNAYSLGDIKDLSVLDLGCGTGMFAIASWIMGAGYSLGIDIDPESIDIGQKTIIDLIGLNQLSDIDESNINLVVNDVNSYNSIGPLLNDMLSQENQKFDKLLEFYNSYSDKSTLDFDSSTSESDFSKKSSSDSSLDVGSHSSLGSSSDSSRDGGSDSSSHLDSDLKFGTLFQNPPFGSQERGTRHADRKFMEFAMNSAEVIYSFHMKSTEEFVIDFYNDLGGEISHKFVYNFPIPKIYDFHKTESKDVKVVVLRVENFK